MITYYTNKRTLKLLAIGLLVILAITYFIFVEKPVSLDDGVNVTTIELSTVDVVRALANDSKDPVFTQAFTQALLEQKNSTKDFIILFAKSYSALSGDAPLAQIFNTHELSELITSKSSNEEVIAVLYDQSYAAISTSIDVLLSRIDRLCGVVPNIKSRDFRYVTLELPIVEDQERVRRLLQTTGSLELWTTYNNHEIYPIFAHMNETINGFEEPEENGIAKQFTLFSKLYPGSTAQGEMERSPVVGYALATDTSAISTYLSLQEVRVLLPRDIKLLWSLKAVDGDDNVFELFAIKANTPDRNALLGGNAVVNALALSDGGSNSIVIGLDTTSARKWTKITGDNIGKNIAIVIDGYVYSAPKVSSEITGGRFEITGNFTINEAKDLANIIKSGKLSVPVKIIAETVTKP